MLPIKRASHTQQRLKQQQAQWLALIIIFAHLPWYFLTSLVFVYGHTIMGWEEMYFHPSHYIVCCNCHLLKMCLADGCNKLAEDFLSAAKTSSCLSILLDSSCHRGGRGRQQLVPGCITPVNTNLSPAINWLRQQQNVAWVWWPSKTFACGKRWKTLEWTFLACEGEKMWHWTINVLICFITFDTYI